MEQPAAPAGHPGRGWRGRPPRDLLLLLAGAAGRAPKRATSLAATGATRAAVMAAVEEVGLTISWREEPSRA